MDDYPTKGDLGEDTDAFFRAGEEGTYTGGPVDSLAPVDIVLNADERSHLGKADPNRLERRERYTRGVATVIGSLAVCLGFLALERAKVLGSDAPSVAAAAPTPPSVDEPKSVARRGEPATIPAERLSPPTGPVDAIPAEHEATVEHTEAAAAPAAPTEAASRSPTREQPAPTEPMAGLHNKSRSATSKPPKTRAERARVAPRTSPTTVPVAAQRAPAPGSYRPPTARFVDP